jgi:hypothetical protein
MLAAREDLAVRSIFESFHAGFDGHARVHQCDGTLAQAVTEDQLLVEVRAPQEAVRHSDTITIIELRRYHFRVEIKTLLALI